MRSRPRVAVVALAVCLAGAVVGAQSTPGSAGPGAPSQTLPGGASQLQETHGDWRVACVQEGERRLCGLLQQQVQKDSGQLVVRVELTAMAGNSVEGTIVLPFGVAVNHPVTLLLDDAPLVTQPYRTCLPVGCVVAVSLSASQLASFRKATMLTITTETVTPGQQASFRVSLNGFASGLARAAALGK